jgi:hypothetical protein
MDEGWTENKVYSFACIGATGRQILDDLVAGFMIVYDGCGGLWAHWRPDARGGRRWLNLGGMIFDGALLFSLICLDLG